MQVTEVYGSPSIILLTYPLEAFENDRSWTYNQTTQYLQYMTSLYSQALMQGMSNVHLLQLDGIRFPVERWCLAHPSVAAHQDIADQLTQYIHAVLPDWASSKFRFIESG